MLPCAQRQRQPHQNHDRHFSRWRHQGDAHPHRASAQEAPLPQFPAAGRFVDTAVLEPEENRDHPQLRMPFGEVSPLSGQPMFLRRPLTTEPRMLEQEKPPSALPRDALLLDMGTEVFSGTDFDEVGTGEGTAAREIRCSCEAKC